MNQLSQIKKQEACKYDESSSDGEEELHKKSKKFHDCINTATQKDKLFRDKSSSFYTQTPVAIEEKWCNHGKKTECRNVCGCDGEKHEECEERE